jgi:hypothetical protein
LEGGRMCIKKEGEGEGEMRREEWLGQGKR